MEKVFQPERVSSPSFRSTHQTLADDDEDAGHVVGVGGDDLAILDDGAEDLVGALLGLELGVLLGDEVGLDRAGGTTSLMLIDWKMPSVDSRMKSSLPGSRS